MLPRLLFSLAAATVTLSATGCLATIPDYVAPPTPTVPPPPGVGSGSDNLPPAPAGSFVTSPLNGQMMESSSDPITVTGTYTGASSTVSVEIFDTSQTPPVWTSVGAAAVQGQSFSTEISGLNNLQFPQGGLLALRVVDANQTGLPYQQNNDATSSNTRLVIGSRGSNPTDWTFLTRQGQGSPEETKAYYQTIAAPQTLSDFRSAFNLDAQGAVNTFYFNKGDLFVGRALTCNTSDAGQIGCAVSALGDGFGESESNAITDVGLAAGGHLRGEIATVAMVYSPFQGSNAPNATQFIVYDVAGGLQDQAKLDLVGNNQSIPQNCLNCHGGDSTYDPESHSVVGARFLQLDPLAMDFSPSATFASQRTSLFQTQQLIDEAGATPAAHELFQGEWTEDGGTASFNPNFVPGAWNETQRDAALYQQAIAPFCRGCHVSITSNAALAWATPADFQANAQKIIAEVCNASDTNMPVAQATSTRFFNGITPGCNEAGCTPNLPQTPMSARAMILEYLNQPEFVSGCQNQAFQGGL